MKKGKWVPATVGTAIVAAILALPGAGVAYASGNGDVTGIGNIPVLSGNTITAPVSAPVNLCGLAVAVAGSSDAGCAGGSGSAISQDGSSGSGGTGSHDGNVTGAGNIPVGSGNTLTAPVSVPVNVCGVSGAIAGAAHSGCHGGSSSAISGPGGGISSHGNVTGAGNIPVLSGNTITAPVSAPVNVCGIAVAVLGLSDAGCMGGSASCIGSNCNTPCTSCHSRQHCLRNDCPTPPPCTSCHTPPPCTSNCHIPPPCTGNDCNKPPPCTSNCHIPPPCPCSPGTPAGPPHGTSPHGTSPHGTSPHGTSPRGTTTTTVTSRIMPSGNSLPTTGADLLLLGAAALGTAGAGAGAIALARRRRTGEAP